MADGTVQGIPNTEGQTETSIVNANAVETSASVIRSTPLYDAHVVHELLIENNILRRRVESQSKKKLDQRRTIMDLRKENSKFKRKLSLRNSFLASYRKTKLEVRNK